MKRPRVLVTRAAEDAEALCAALAAAGCEAVRLPLLAYEECADADAVRKALDEAGSGWIALTSPRAAPALRGVAPLPAGWKVAALGPMTAFKLRAAGISVDLAGEGDGAAGLVRAFAGQDEPGPATSRVLWLCGSLAGDELRFGLKNLGYDVRPLEVYRTVRLRPAPDAVESALRGLDAACFASPSAVAAFVEAVPEGWAEGDGARVLAVAIGATTEGALVRAGFRRRRVAADPSPDGVARAVAAGVAEEETT